MELFFTMLVPLVISVCAGIGAVKLFGRVWRG